MTRRIAVLASGGGTNLQAILDHFDALGDGRPGEVRVVASDRAAAGAVDRARARGIPTALIREDGGRAGEPIDEILHAYQIDIVALAGYLRLVPAATVERLHGRIVNVHPALLPAFGGSGMYGARVHQAVLDSGAMISGATVHFVDQAYDRGPVIAQWPVPVLRGDTAASLAARVLAVEHILYPRALAAVAAGAIMLGEDGRVRRGAAQSAKPAAPNRWAFSLTELSPPRLVIEIARALGA